ncbi:hypothetical protein D3C76_662390 [compost metagenome]
MFGFTIYVSKGNGGELMKKIFGVILCALIGVGTVSVYANSNLYSNNSKPTTLEQDIKNASQSTKISKDDFQRMLKVIKDVNAGILPKSALVEAEQLLNAHPEYITIKQSQ